MKTQIIMKKLFIVLLVLSCGTPVFAQFANPLIQNLLMSPNPLQVGQTGLLTADVRNAGATDVTAGCALVTISVPSTISGITLTLNTGLSDPIWAFNNYGSAGTIVLRNTLGLLLQGGGSHPIVLNVSGDFHGGPLGMIATISLASGCTGLGDNTSDNTATSSLTVYGVYTWVGGATNALNSKRWDIAANWSPATIPFATDNAIIPNVEPGRRLPLLNQNQGITDIQIAANAIVDLNSKKFTINGAVTGTGTLKGSFGSDLEINGNAGNLRFTTGSAVLRDLTLNINAQATLATPLDISSGNLGSTNAGTLIVASGATLTTGGNLTIKSDDVGTASVGTSAGTITGTATVERAIPDPGHRAWHLLGTNTVGSQTIFDSWQEGGTNVPNKGTWLTSGSSLLPGFDGNSINGASILIHDQTVPSWTTIPVANTNATALSSRPGYFLFIRGDRSYTPTLPTPTASTNTVLRSLGNLKQGTLAPVTVSATGSGRTLVGNPYASAINMEPIFAGTANLDQNMMVWDPALTGTSGVGGYRAVVRTGVNAYNQTPVVLGGTTVGDPDIQYIHSGSAFFLKATGANANVVFTEAMKSAAPTTVYNPIVATTKEDQTIIANLMIPQTAGGTNLADGIRISYNPAYSASLTDDIEKLGNWGENLSSYRNGTKLIVEKRPMIVATDTIFLRMTNTTAKDYRFQIGTMDFVQTDVSAYLEDTYLKTKTLIDLSGSITYADFSITADAASANGDRFRIVFAKAVPVPQTIITIKAAQNGSNISVDWKAAMEYNIKQYEVEKSTDGVRFSGVETRATTGVNGLTVDYNWLDVKPVAGDNYYRIRSTGINGEQKYSAMVKVNIVVGQPLITLYPNPVTDKATTVKFADMYKGTYQLVFIGSNGQAVLTKDIIHPGGTATHPVNLKSLPAGNYLLEINSPNNHKTVISLNVLN